MEAKIDKFVRTKGYENSEAMAEIRRRISEEVELQYAEEAKLLREENKAFRDQELAFRKEAHEIIKKAYAEKSLVGVKTQTGHNGSLIREYVGHIEYEGQVDSLFNLVDPNVYGGKPFSIGLSCLLSIKIL